MKKYFIIVFWKALEIYKLQEYAKAYRVSPLKSWRWPSGDSSISNQWHHVMAPFKPYNFCLKHFFLKCIVCEIFDRSGTFGTPYIYNFAYMKICENILRKGCDMELCNYELLFFLSSRGGAGVTESRGNSQ